MNRLRSRPLSNVQLGDALRSGLDALPDPELLERFARYTDHAAFEVLVRRHGPMVFGVCRRTLIEADAEDAFQATFLVLIRKARAIRGGKLGPWLYGVACRVALKARSRAARLAAYRVEATDMIPDPSAPSPEPDWLPILDAELAALPAKYRDALVICELQGVSRAEAAKALGLREGTLSSRLARGRDLLRKRLLKHGTLLPTGGLAALFSATGVGRATVPLALVMRTADLAKVTTGSAAGTVPVSAAQLMDEVLKGMFLTKLRAASGVALALLLAVGVSAAALPDSPAASHEEKGSLKRALPHTSPPPAHTDTKPSGAKRSDREGWQAIREPFAVSFADAGTVLPDTEALMGLWTLEKANINLGADKGGDQDKLRAAEESRKLIGKMQFLVTGDIWWNMLPVPEGALTPMVVRIDPSKNPKWIDIHEVGNSSDVTRGIYELAGDKLRICLTEGQGSERVAEFSPSDGVPMMVLEFRRDKLPPSPADNGLVGSWQGEVGDRLGVNPESGMTGRFPASRVVIRNGYFFALSDETGKWIGGRYTVDTTKNPKWIDVDLIAPYADNITKLYGCYEANGKSAKVVLGKTGKRPLRPLEFKSTTNALYFDLIPSAGPLVLDPGLEGGFAAPKKPAPSPTGPNIANQPKR